MVFRGVFEKIRAFRGVENRRPKGGENFSVRVFKVFLYKKRRIFFFRFPANRQGGNFFGPEKKTIYAGSYFSEIFGLGGGLFSEK